MIDDFKLKGRRKKSHILKIFIIALVILVLILAKATWSVYAKNKESKENLEEARLDLEDLKKREKDLGEEISSLSTERGVDEEIKDKFRVTKEGEELIVLIDSPEVDKELEQEENKSLWKRFLNLF